MNKPKIRFNEFENIWNKSKLGEIYEIYSGNTPSRSDNRNYQNGEIPWIKTTDLNNSIICSNEEKISVYGVTKLKLLPTNSVLIAMYGGFNQIGRTGLLAYPSTINQALAALMPVNEINPNFLLNFLNFKKESWKKVAASSRKDPNITKNDIEKFIISFPSPEEQSAIGSLFRTLDDLLASYKDNLANYQSLKTTMLYKMFPKARQTVPEIRLDGFEGEWEIRKLNEVSEVYDGTHQTPNYTESGVKFLSVENISTLESEKYISEEDFEKDFKVFPEFGDVLMTRIGSIGVPNIVNTNEKIAFYVSLALLKPKKKTDSLFMKSSIESNPFQEELWKKTLHIAFPKKINMNDISQSTIKCPSYEEQQAIGAYFSILDSLISAHQEKISQLETLKKKLLQDMFI